MSLQDTSSLISIIIAPLAVIGLIVAYFQLRSQIKSARNALTDATVAAKRARSVTLAEQIMAIDNALYPYDDVRTLINQGKRPEYIPLRRYVAVFERMGLLLELDLISIEKVDQYFGGRIQKLIKYERARNIMKKPSGWRSFIFLWQALYNYRNNKRDLPPPPQLVMPENQDEDARDDIEQVTLVTSPDHHDPVGND